MKCPSCNSLIIDKDYTGRESILLPNYTNVYISFKKTEPLEEGQQRATVRETKLRVPICKGCEPEFDIDTVVEKFDNTSVVKDLVANGFSPAGTAPYTKIKR